FLEERKANDFRAIEKKSEQETKKKTESKSPNQYHDQKKLKGLKNKLSQVESKISSLEKEISEIDHELIMNYDQTIAQPNFFDKYQKKKKQLESLMQQWEDLTLQLEK
ncbi:MAG: ABC transporter ATP-binding protein, partial [Muriicola sp.]|nr:ABC transporter ATP-binding protein [Muriicola sp.]NNK36457.1 ABC transporter ATP-binding protein [Eudoraea sp.]